MKTQVKFLGVAVMGLCLSGLVMDVQAGYRGGVSVGGSYSSRGGSYSVGYSGGGSRYGGRYYGGGYYGNRYYGGYNSWGWGYWGLPLALSFSYASQPYYGDYYSAYTPPPVYNYYTTPTVVYTTPPAAPAMQPAPPPIANTAPPPTAVEPARTQSPPPPPAQEYNLNQTPALADVKALVKSGISDSVIISQMRNSRVVYRLSTAEIIELKESGVSNQVLDFMINTPSLYRTSAPQPN